MRERDRAAFSNAVRSAQFAGERRQTVINITAPQSHLDV